MTDTATPPERSQAFPDPIPGVIPHGSICIVMGPPKRGKTALLAEWCARWLSDRTICGLPTQRPPAIGIFTTDHKWHLNQGPWFEKAGCLEIRHYSLRDQSTMLWRKLRIPSYADEVLNRGLDTLALPPGALVLIDVIGPFITSRLNDYAEVVGGLGTISQLMERRQLTCIAVSHMGKQKGDSRDQYKDPFERIMGSGAQIGFSDTMIYLLGPQDISQPYYEVGWQPTLAPIGTFRFKRDAFGLFVPYEEDKRKQGALGVSSYDAPIGVEATLAIMPTEPPGWAYHILLGYLADQCHVGYRRCKHLAMCLVRDGRIVRIRRGFYVKAKVC